MKVRKLNLEELEYIKAGKIDQAMSTLHIGYYYIGEIINHQASWNRDVIEYFSTNYKYKNELSGKFEEFNLELRLQPLFNRFSKGPTKEASELIGRIIHIEDIQLIDDPEYPNKKTYRASWNFST